MPELGVISKSTMQRCCMLPVSRWVAEVRIGYRRDEFHSVCDSGYITPQVDLHATAQSHSRPKSTRCQALGTRRDQSTNKCCTELSYLTSDFSGSWSLARTERFSTEELTIARRTLLKSVCVALVRQWLLFVVQARLVLSCASQNSRSASHLSGELRNLCS